MGEVSEVDETIQQKRSVDLALAAEVIRDYENGPDGGFAKFPYLCPGGVHTIGWGHAITSELELRFFEQGISAEDAERLMFQDLRKAKDSLDTLCKATLNAAQRGALISFIFNVGHANFAESTLLRRLNDGQIGLAPAELRRWIYADGRKLRGLVRRREAEITLGAPW